MAENSNNQNNTLNIYEKKAEEMTAIHIITKNDKFEETEGGFVSLHALLEILVIDTYQFALAFHEVAALAKVDIDVYPAAI